MSTTTDPLDLSDLAARGLTLGIGELSVILGRAEKTLLSDLSRRPQNLPPSFCVGATRRWRAADVIQWISERVSSVPRRTGRSVSGSAGAEAKKRRRGAPTKAERLGRQK